MGLSEAIKIITKRIKFLEKRISESDKDLSFDKAEAAALKCLLKEVDKNKLKVNHD